MRPKCCAQRQHLPAAAATRGAELEPANVENGEGDLVTLADLAQHVRRRDAHVVEVDRARGRALDPHLLLLGSEGDARRGERHDEGGVPGLVDLGEGHHHVGDAGVGDPLLLPIDDVAIAVARGTRLDAHGVGAGARLGQGVGAHDRAGGHAR